MREQGGGRLRKLYEALFAADASPVTQDQLLWRYVILQAIRDATSQPRSLKLMRRERKKRGIEWLTEGGEDFRNVCDLAGILPERVQTFAKYLLTQPPKGNDMAKIAETTDDIVKFNPNSDEAKINSFIQRVEKLEEEKKQIGDTINSVLSEAKSQGFDSKIIKEVIKLRKVGQEKRDEFFFLLSRYSRAAGVSIQLDLFSEQ